MTSADGEILKLGIDAVGTWCQFQIELRGQAGRPEIREIIINSNKKE